MVMQNFVGCGGGGGVNKMYHVKMVNSLLYKRAGDWAELNFAKTSGTVTRVRGKIGQ